MDFNIWNNCERPIRCISTDDDELLQVGEVYTVDDVEVHSWHTLVYVKEVPGYGFNSVLFEEI